MLRNLPADGQVQVVDFSGRLCYTGAIAAGDQALNLAGLSNGLYLVRYWSEGKIWQGKLVVQQ
jgi:hypothetical protein